MVLFSYIFMTIWCCFWVGLMYNQPERSHAEKMRWIFGWAILALVVNQVINHGVIYLLPDEDPMQHAYYVMYLFTASAVVTALILWIGLRTFRRHS